MKKNIKNFPFLKRKICPSIFFISQNWYLKKQFENFSIYKNDIICAKIAKVIW